MNAEEISITVQTFSDLMRDRFALIDPSTVLENGKLVDEQVKLRVRAYLYAAENDEERKKRKEEIIHFFGLKAQQVSSLFAWVKYGNRKMNGKETDEQRSEVLELLEDVHDSFERALLVFEIRELYQLTTDCIEKILQDDSQVSDLVDPKKEVPQVSTEDPQIPSAVTESELVGVSDDSKPTQTQTVGDTIVIGETFDDGKTGDLVSYSNPRKERWRQQVLDDIVKYTSADRISTMRVLTLPGKQCLEIPGLLSIGIRPENIVGVEGGSQEARLEFMRNATRYGIQTRLGKLEDIVPREKDRFGAVLLDFHGQWSPSKERILDHLLLDDFAVVMINVMAKREGREVQSGMREIDAHFRHYEANPVEDMLNKTIEIDLNDPDPQQINLMNRLFGENQRKLIEEGRLVRELRDAGASDLLAFHLSSCREENWANPSLFRTLPGLEILGLDSSHLEQTEGFFLSKKLTASLVAFDAFFKRLFSRIQFYPKILSRFERSMIQTARKTSGELAALMAMAGIPKGLSDRNMMAVKFLVIKLQYMYTRLTMSLPRIIALDKYSYESQTGAGTCTFYTDVVSVESPYQIARDCHETMDFLLYGMHSALIELYSKPEFMMVMRDKTGQVPHQYLTGDPSLAPPQAPSLSVARSMLSYRRERKSARSSDKLSFRDGHGSLVHQMKISRLLKDIERFDAYTQKVGMDDDVQKRRRNDPRIVIE